ncbi:MAG: histidine ammonia-lyase [Pseudogulbenkiania sp.]|nr:histidine ammonia-lyase [Pseudogulbenkiania sp.]
MAATLSLDAHPFGWRELAQVAAGARLELGEDAWLRIRNARAIVERIVERGERAYGITTGLGALCNVVLAPDQLSKLSSNTLQSHACGVGEPLSIPLTRAVLAAQLQNYAHGHSGVSPAVVEGLLAMLNHGITPVVPAGGSVGYLTHMAHMALPLIGLGEAWVDGERLPGAAALARRGLKPVTLGAKDGLSLVNGTPCMTGLMAMALARAERLAQWADVVGAMSFEALKGQWAAFDAEALAAKPYPGAQQVGANLRGLLAGSANLAAHQGIRTQDALSIRSMPQIHGASRDQFAHIGRQVDIELASATDNPQVFGTPDDYRVISQANPHGQSLAMAADLLAIALAELAGVAERRIDRLVNPLVSGLPPFLLENSGVNSGLMIVQYVAASLVAENKVLAHPMVVDNFVTSALQEDHLSLATPAALKALKVLDNVETVLAIEYLVAAQALHFFDPASLGGGSRAALDALRERIPPYTEDRVVAPDIVTAVGLLHDPALLKRIETAIGMAL